MDESYAMVKDILSTNNTYMVTNIQQKIDDVMELLKDNTKNSIAINLLKEVSISMNSIVSKNNDISDKLNALLKKMGENMKTYGTKNYDDGKYIGN